MTETSGTESVLRALDRLAGRELVLSDSPDAEFTWLLRSGDDRLGVLDTRAATVRGATAQWHIESERRRGRWQLEFRPSSGPDADAIFYSRHWLPGGRLMLPGQHWYALRPTWPLRQPWQIRDQDDAVFARLRQKRYVEWLVELSPALREEPAALLVILAMSYAILFEREQAGMALLPAG